MERYTCIVLTNDPSLHKLIEGYSQSIPHLQIIGNVNNIDQATQETETRKPDILLIDLETAGEEGPEFAFVLQHQPELIMMGDKPKNAKDNYFVEIGEYLEKPVEPDAFAAAVNKCVETLELFRV